MVAKIVSLGLVFFSYSRIDEGMSVASPIFLISSKIYWVSILFAVWAVGSREWG